MSSEGVDVYREIELLMGEYLCVISDWRASDLEREYYRAKLDALYDLNMRIL